MNIAVQYVTDSAGKPQAVQLSLTDWEALMDKLKGYEQTLSLKSDLEEAFAHVEQMRSGKAPKTSLTAFLDEL